MNQILVIEDNWLIAEVLSDRLSLSFPEKEIKIVKSAQAAINAFTAFSRIDGVILDMGMQRIDTEMIRSIHVNSYDELAGLEVYSHIRSISPIIPVVINSANENPKIKEVCQGEWTEFSQKNVKRTIDLLLGLTLQREERALNATR